MPKVTHPATVDPLVAQMFAALVARGNRIDSDENVDLAIRTAHMLAARISQHVPAQEQTPPAK